MTAIASYGAEQIGQAISWPAAVAALSHALASGLDPDAQPRRSAYRFGTGELLTMPASHGRWAGVKLATVAPDEPLRGTPRIHASYLMFDAVTLAPVAQLDGTALTSLRTPAVSALAVDLLAPADAKKLVVFGSGPQAYGHVQALRAIRPVESVHVVGRNPERTDALIERLGSDGIRAVRSDADEVAGADLIACCTTAHEPLFDGTELADSAVVVACGSHTPTAREVDSVTVRRCRVVVESVATALAEAGDVVLAVSDGVVAASDLVPLAELVRSRPDHAPRRPWLVKTVGMGWEDLVIAGAVLDALAGQTE